MRRPPRSLPKRSRMCSRYESVAISTCSMRPWSTAGAAARSSSICSSCSSDSLCPCESKNLTPLYSGGLCDAEMTTPRSSASSATAGVGSTPPSRQSPPAETTPRANASSSSTPDARVSRPTNTLLAPVQSAAARPSRSTSSDVSRSPTIPRTPSVPKYLRAMRRVLPLAELRRLACLVQAGLLALDLARVAREEARPLERHPELGIHLDERSGDAVPDRARLTGRAAAVDAHAQVVLALELGRLQRRQRDDAVHETWKVLLDRPAVDPGRAVAGPQDHARDGRLALAGAEVLRGRRHALRRLPAVERLRRLRRVRMLGAGVDLQLRQLRASEPVARQHPLHGLAQDLRRLPVELLAQRPRAQPARVTRVAVVALLVELLAGHAHLLGVDDDDEVAGVDVRRVLRLALAAQAVGDLRRQPSERLPVGVDEVPVALDLARFRGIGLHAEKGRTSGPPAANCSSPRRKSAAPPRLGWGMYGAPSAASAILPTATTRLSRASSRAKTTPSATSRAVGRRFEVAVPGCVGTTFHSSTCSARPSSRSTRRTTVAVASAGPVPVTCRSEVNGIPEMRAPR